MATKTEKKHAGESAVSEANGERSRETVTVAVNQDLQACEVVAKNGDDDVVALNPAAGDSTAQAVGVLFEGVKTDSSKGKGVLFARDCVHADVNLQWPAMTGAQKITALNQLRALGIIVR